MPKYQYLKDLRLNHKGVRAIAVGRESRAAVVKVAEKGKVLAAAIAPHKTGAYARRFHVNAHINREFGDERYVRARWCADIYNNDPGARWIEAGHPAWHDDDGNRGGYHVLRRTIVELRIANADRPR